ncbi:M23 family metallopeptidase [Sphingomonas sp.]|jgi:murein DD-endopeptidase MepM/ murein hydrolase activator NlpD|uniref:M23 family metallopeptidase n=1 Tax=Sphingomonas sp. TaxID=28214 RepID=UPI002D807669|nr:M23 family metallopeptidase [Sphingomonas sp.]HEU0044935.1 M23 family metallopeptidase [Sphingomonas sp.]
MTKVGWVVLGAILLVAGLFASMLSFGRGKPPAARVVVAPNALPPAEPWRGGEVPRLIIPVAEVTGIQLSDSWGDPRGGGRGHKGIDIMAPPGTAVIATASGTIEKLFQSRLGGTTLYQRSPDGGWTFYYAHLQQYAPGVREGMKVEAGDVLGYVGDTGEGSGGKFHLHFSVARLAPEQKWYQGADVNPYPLLVRR